jgi:Uma2 family endonuclease
MRHNRFALNVARLLADRLDGSRCQVFINDMKLHVQASDSVYYPDVFVYCWSGIANDEKVAQDATFIVELPSESTAVIDHREKLVAYQKLPGLRAYRIVSQTEEHVEVHSRNAYDQWQALACTAAESINMEWWSQQPVALATLYAGTDTSA